MHIIKFAKVFLLPILVAGGGMVALVAFACFIAFDEQAQVTSWRFLGLISVPAQSKIKILASLGAGLSGALIAYCTYLYGIAAAIRRNGLRLSEFVELPSKRRRELILDVPKS